MFDRIAGVYDPLNAVISGFQEPRWRRRLVAAMHISPGMSVLDVATGTGAVARDLARRVGPTGHVLGSRPVGGHDRPGGRPAGKSGPAAVRAG